MRSRSLIVALLLAVAALSALSAYQAYLLRSLRPLVHAAADPRAAVARPRPSVSLALESTPSPRLEARPRESSRADQSLRWKSVETPDYRTYVENLRTIGCPEQTVRDIVIADVNKLYASRRAELMTQGQTPKFWQATPPLTDEERAERGRRLAALEREQKEAIRTLLGVDPDTERRKSRDGVTYPDNRLGNLSAEKQDRVSLLREEFNEKWSQVQAAAGQPGASPDAISAELRRLDEDRRSNLAQILTPEELLEHELQTSWTAIELRNQLSGFQPSEEEFLKIYELQKAFDNEYVHYFNGRTDAGSVAQKAQAEQELEARIRSALGEERYGVYLRTRPPGRP